jgi:glutamate racemase
MKIGVFDSGFGGLTVLRSLLSTVPQGEYIYLGDSARLPYGSKSPRTVAHYASSSARFLHQQGAEALVIACNSASAVALDEIRAAVPIPVIGVIEPGAATAASITRSRRVCVIGTQATVSSHAYRHALQGHRLEVEEKACPLFVALVEEGWTDHPVTEEVARIYLREMFDECSQRWGDGAEPDTLVLGCTHYPLLKPLLARVLPPHMQMVDSAEAVAQQVAAMRPAKANGSGNTRFFATDSLEKFRSLGARFLGRTIEDVELVTLPE